MMRTDRRLLGLHGTGVALALTAALVWPRPGEAALMVPLPGRDLDTVLAWAGRQDVDLLSLDPDRGRVIARVTDNRSLLGALGEGIVPVAARSPGCRQNLRRQTHADR